MNLPPLLQRQRKGKHFSSPLAGSMLATEQFRSSITSKKNVSTISHSLADSVTRSKLGSFRTQHRLQKTHIEEVMTPRKTPYQSSDRMKAFCTLDTIDTGGWEKTKAGELLNRSKMGVVKAREVYCFPEVEIVPLHLIERYEEIALYRTIISLQKYFRMYFSGKIAWDNVELNRKLQKFLPLLRDSGLLDSSIVKQKWPSEFWEVGSTQELLEMMRKYDKNSEYWNKYLLVLVQLYCVPHQGVRASALESVTLAVSKQLRHKLQSLREGGKSKDEELVFLREDGTPVLDFIDIPFSTTKLYLTRKTDPPSHAESLKGYLEMVRRYQEDVKKRGFMGRLRSHFRKEIAVNKCDENQSINYNADYPSIQKERNTSLRRAMDLLDEKKRRSKNNLTALSCVIPAPAPRPKSRESIWREENVESSEGSFKMRSNLYYFNFQLGSRAAEAQAISEFKRYNAICREINPGMGEGEVYLNVLEGHHPVLRELAKSRFHSMKLLGIFEAVMHRKLPANYAMETMEWQHFTELFLICSKDIGSLLEQADRLQVVRDFVEGYLEMGDESYYRQQLAGKMFRMLEGGREEVSLMEEVVWSWLEQSGFVLQEAVERELLWTFPARSKTFYLLVVSLVLATFQTTPLDLAHQMLL